MTNLLKLGCSMIRFESDARTRGEQMVLRMILRGEGIAHSDWHSLRAQDFSHDLHGQIFRHAERLAERRVQHDPAAVFASMRRERHGCVQGVAGYLDWLAGDDPCFATGRLKALLAFRDALDAQHEAGTQPKAMRGSR